MLILPLENRLDWRRPPVVTLLLVLVNVLVYFTGLSGDEQAIHRAWQLYNADDLIEVEAAPFRRYWREHGDATSGERLGDSDEELVGYILWDLEFDAWLRSHPPGDAPAGWRAARNQFEAQRAEHTTIGFGLIPAEPSAGTVLSSMYLHGSVWHLVGNMVFLFLFGFTLERAVGRLNYAVLYHLAGALSGALTIIAQPDSHVPTIGASGAVSGLMGAYIGIYRLRKIRFFYNVLFYFGEFRAPALWLFPVWLAKELYGQYFGDQGVAYWAHIGGLLGGLGAGLALSLLKRGVDLDYLEAGVREQAVTASKDRLDALIDQFKYDQAKQLAAELLEAHPQDAALWSRYLGVLRTDTSQLDYHKAVLRLLALAPRAIVSPELGDLIEETYRTYGSSTHPQPALKNAALLERLGPAFLRSGRLDAARDVADRLLARRCFNEEVKKLVNALANRLQSAGEVNGARRYRELLNRF